MSRGPSENSSVDLLAYERPSPAKALAILEGYGMDACLGRWPFLTANAISKIVEAGRAERNLNRADAPFRQLVRHALHARPAAIGRGGGLGVMRLTIGRAMPALRSVKTR